MLRCGACGLEQQVRVACPTRCPRCPFDVGRTGASTVALLPRVPVRHWVLTLPEKWRWTLARRPETLRRVSRAFMREVFGWLRERAAEHTGRSAGLHCGAVAAVHRTGSSLELNVHLHGLVLDGVYLVEGDGEAVFHPTHDDPSGSELSRIVRGVQRRAREIMSVKATPSDEEVRLAQQLGAGPVARSSVRRVRLPGAPPRSRTPRSGRAVMRSGLRVHAGEPVPADDRPGLARLARYVTRPLPDPSSFSRLPSGTIRYRLEHPFSDGTTHIELSPEALAQTLAQLVPAEASPRVQYHGILAPRAAHRWRVIPGQLRLFPEQASTTRAEGSRRLAKRSPAAPSDAGSPMLCPTCETPMDVVTTEDFAVPPRVA